MSARETIGDLDSGTSDERSVGLRYSRRTCLRRTSARSAPDAAANADDDYGRLPFDKQCQGRLPRHLAHQPGNPVAVYFLFP